MGTAPPGTSSRLTLVTIHGFWSSPETWHGLESVWREDPVLAEVDLHPFGYESPKKPVLPFSMRRIPDHDDIAQTLASEFTVRLAEGPVAFVTHSQGGLVLQRFLAWMLQQGRGRELARIVSATVLACPSNGSDYLRALRAAAGAGRHPQAARLATLDRQVADVQRAVLADVVNADRVSDRQCPIPLHVYAGASDNVVPAASAQAAFPGASTLRGDHSSILDPDLPGSQTAATVAHHLVADLAAWRTRERPDGEASGAPGARAPGVVEGPAAFGGSVILQGDNVAGRDMRVDRDGRGDGRPSR